MIKDNQKLYLPHQLKDFLKILVLKISSQDTFDLRDLSFLSLTLDLDIRDQDYWLESYKQLEQKLF
jgi:hypothetical protein